MFLDYEEFHMLPVLLFWLYSSLKLCSKSLQKLDNLYQVEQRLYFYFQLRKNPRVQPLHQETARAFNPAGENRLELLTLAEPKLDESPIQIRTAI
jgi:hypothetical protein